MSRTRSAWRLVAPLAVVVVLAGACSSGGDSTNSGQEIQAKGVQDINAQPTESLKQGGTFRWATNEIPPNYNYNQVDGATSDLHDIVYGLMPLAFFSQGDGTQAVDTNYFTDIKLTSTDPEVVTYTINPKAKWSNGRALDWEDLQAQFTALNGKNADYLVSSSTGYEDIGKVEMGTNAQQAVVTFAKPFSDWQSLYSPLYPKEENSSATTFNTGLLQDPGITAGPFKFKNVDQTAKTVTTVPDPNWWGDKPVLDSIVYVALDQTAQVAALANNEIDYSNIGTDVNDNKTARATAGITVRSALAPDYRHITFNGGKGSILADKDLRLAVMKGIDTSGIAKALLNGVAADPKPLGNHIYVDGLQGYEDNSAVASYNPEEASSALDSLGWTRTGDATRTKDGKTLEIRDVIPAGVATSSQEAQIAQQNLAQIGVKLTIDTVPSQGFFSDYVDKGNFDVTHFAWLGTPFASSNASIYGLSSDTQQNFGRIGSDAINALFTQANAEFDPAKKTDLYNQIDKAVWDEGFSLLLYQRPQNHAVRSTVANFGSPAFGDVDYTKIGFTQ